MRCNPHNSIFVRYVECLVFSLAHIQKRALLLVDLIQQPPSEHNSQSLNVRERGAKKLDAYRMDEELATAISVLEGILREDQDEMWNVEQERDAESKTEQNEMWDAESKTEQDEMWDDLPSEVLEEIIKGESEKQNIK